MTHAPVPEQVAAALHKVAASSCVVADMTTELVVIGL